MKDNPILKSNLSMNSDVPLYYQLITLIKRNISVGLLKEGDMLPSELELCNTFNISRTTVRQAIGELESEGFVVRRRGKGTFLCKPKMKRNLNNIYSFSTEMRQLGLDPSSKFIGFDKIKPKEDLIKAFNLKDESQLVFKIMRIRLADNEPLLLETTYIPEYIYPNLTEAVLKEKSLYTIIKNNAGFEPHTAEESYESVILNDKMAKMLGCKSNSSGMFVQRKTWTSTGELYELTQSFMRGDRSKFVVTLVKDGVSFKRDIDDLENKR
jgi:GntR family transcriptional regulator